MNISTLQYFISAAELCNFTKAAKKHYIAQTAISQQIAKLEQEIGTLLFIREKNRVVLTDAGNIFYKDIKKVLLNYENAMDKVRNYNQDENQVITIGYSSLIDFYVLSDCITQFQQLHPTVEFVFKEDTLSNLIQEVMHGVCDLYVNMSITFKGVDMQELNRYTIYYGKMLLAVSKDHKKASQESIDAIDLKDEKFIILNRENTENGFLEMHQHCKEDGYEIKIEKYVETIAAQIFYVEMGRGVAFVQDRMENPRPEKVQFLTIRDSAHRYGIDLLWHRSNQQTSVNQFISFVKKKLPQYRS